MSFLEEVTNKINKLARQTNIREERSLAMFKGELTLECLETLNNQTLLSSIENESVLMNEILNCMNAAEQEAQE